MEGEPTRVREKSLCTRNDAEDAVRGEMRFENGVAQKLPLFFHPLSPSSLSSFILSPLLSLFFHPLSPPFTSTRLEPFHLIA